jgi:hypothetical protein
MIASSTDLRLKVKAWRNAYHASRYLDYLPLCDLLKRRNRIFQNIFSFREHRRMSGFRLREEEEAMFQALVEVNAELRMRKERSRQGAGSIRELRTLGAPPEFLRAAESAIRGIDYPDGWFLIRYAKRSYLEEALGTGKVRISPARKYNDADLPVGVKDNELVKEVQAFPIDVRAIHMLSGKNDTSTVPGSTFVATGSDYLFLSLSRTLLPTLFWEFCAEEPACLVIRDGPKFLEALRKASMEILGGWKFSADLVKYADPHPPGEPPGQDGNVAPWIQKHFRYFYQGEFRVAWIPPRPVRELGYVKLPVANLEDHVELLTFTV